MADPPPRDVALVSRCFAAFNQRDLDTVLQIVHPSAAIIPPPSPHYAPPGTTYHGHAGVRSLLRAIFARVPRVRIEPESFKAVGSRLLVNFALVEDSAAADGSVKGVALCRIADGRIVRSEAFASEQEAVRVAGIRLTPREQEIFRLLALGLNAWEVARRLEISPDTVRTHVRNGVVKLGAKTRVQAVALALTRGEIEL